MATTFLKRAVQIGAAIAVLAIIARIYLSNTFPWEHSWIQNATFLTLDQSSGFDGKPLAGSDLQSFLADFEVNNPGPLSLRCSTSWPSTGRITIADQSYPAELSRDKFVGDILVVHTRWKKLEIVRSRRHGAAGAATMR